MMLINGEADGALDPRDRGLHYGDGLFETLDVRNGQPRHWQRHMARLERGCRRLMLPLPDVSLLEQEARNVCAGADRAVLKILWTRGPGGRGYAPGAADTPTRIVAQYPAPQYPQAYREEGIRARWCRHRLGANPALAGIKHLNRLDQVLARSEWHDPQIAEAIVCDQGGKVISGTMSNVFLVRNGRLSTPDLTDCGIAGITRERILELAHAEGFGCSVTTVSPQELIDADEVFVCNSVNGVWQLRDLAQRQWPRGTLCRYLADRLDSD